ncbi:DUF5672 family protein [Caballeronia sp. BR00000012568055]|uniref:DUF5672 family protein n=1 Tax=Caballeronia sp. BR00000012568055 TaxID=2918761 RepID=UPI0023F9897D|nr:DUF5672 family protein [Caballeronia sp. BR00000012568055]
MNEPKLNLRNVTLCAVDCLNPLLAARALDISRQHGLFGDTLLLTDQRLEVNARIALIPSIRSREEYSEFILKRLAEHIHTPWVLLVQWDGYVLNPAAWTEDFFAFDYVGARWPHRPDGMNVGNGGFSLRSKRLLDILSNDDRFTADSQAVEDELICREYRPLLESEYGIRFATTSLADRFSVEFLPISDIELGFAPSSERRFGFHGIFHLARYATESELEYIAENAHPRTVHTGDFVSFCVDCAEQEKMLAAGKAYWRLRRFLSVAEMQSILADRAARLSRHTPAGLIDRFESMPREALTAA